MTWLCKVTLDGWMDLVIINVCTMIRLSSRVRLILFFFFWMITCTHIQRSTIHLPCHVGFSLKHTSVFKINIISFQYHLSQIHCQKMNSNIWIIIILFLACTVHYGRSSCSTFLWPEEFRYMRKKKPCDLMLKSWHPFKEGGQKETGSIHA